MAVSIRFRDTTDKLILITMRVVYVWFSIILAHSDWSKFEMEHSDWSCAYCRQWAQRENTLLSLKYADFGTLSDWSRAVSPLVGATSQLC